MHGAPLFSLLDFLVENLYDSSGVCLRIAPSIRVVIPAKAGIQSFEDLLDAGSSPA